MLVTASSAFTRRHAASASMAVVGFDPADVTLNVGESMTVAVMVAQVNDLWGFDLDIHFEPDQDTWLEWDV